MDFDKLYESIIPSEQGILSSVDEYTLYCFYTGIEDLTLGRAYNAPYYRQDRFPSFSVYESKSQYVDYMWKDHATGESGTIFKLIQKIEQLNNLNQVFARINEDFCLGYYTSNPVRKDKIVWYEKPTQNQIKIRIKDKPFDKEGSNFWQQFGISANLLNLYNVNQVEYFWLHDEQQVPTTAYSLTFSYRIGKYYQLYSPYASKQYKFRNDLPENYFFGYLQLPEKGDKLVIDKSCKDVIFCRRLGLNAVSGKSESTMIPHSKMLELQTRFREIYLTLDPDPCGKTMTDKYLKIYPWLHVRFLPKHKDKTDNCIAEGLEKTERIIKELIE